MNAFFPAFSAKKANSHGAIAASPAAGIRPASRFAPLDHGNLRYQYNPNNRQLMSSESSSPNTFLAFISATSFEGLGACGGLLLVNQSGRPVEFHCTSPVTTNKTQSILFGQSLNRYLYCEQIAQALADELKQRPAAFLTNVPELAEIGSVVETPVVFVGDISATQFVGAGLQEFEIDGRKVHVLRPESGGEQTIENSLRAFHRSVPIDEPFERIAQALEEAHAVAR